jgi:cytochrome b6-f complex iron-sulfur subunit
MTFRRREFVKQAGFLAMAACCGLFENCTTYKNIRAKSLDGKVIVIRADMQDNNFAVVHVEGLRAPLYLCKTGTDSYSAVLMLCTHKQCEVKPTGNFLTCPCHGSEFTATGKVQKEPATQDLFPYKTSYDENNIYIHLK